jgi:hypothetical protein
MSEKDERMEGGSNNQLTEGCTVILWGDSMMFMVFSSQIPSLSVRAWTSKTKKLKLIFP